MRILVITSMFVWTWGCYSGGNESEAKYESGGMTQKVDTFYTVTAAQGFRR